jgi:thiamine phosphate synthase YjbQ (UPF0047 family)
VTPALSPELLSAAKALGLLAADGSLNAGWFSDPSARLATILSNSAQRAALLELLDQLLPPEPVSGTAAGEKWHPLLGAQPRGNLYLTAKNGSSPYVTIGCAGLIAAGAGAATPSAALRVQLPLAQFSGSAASPVAGGVEGPLEISLRVQLDLARPADAIDLAAARIDVELVAFPNPSASIAIVLEGLDLDGTGAKDTPLDPAQLGPEAVEVIAGLIGQKLKTLAGAGPEATAVASHLMPLLGIGDGLPPLPLADLLKGPAALQSWLNALVAAPPRMQTWLEHLAGLLGGGAVVATGAGTAADPWRVALAPLGSGALAVTVAVANARLHVGVEVALVPTAANPQARVEARASLVAIPLAGAAEAQVLPDAIAVLRAPGGAGSLVTSPQITAAGLGAGVRWDGAALAPLLELTGVDLAGTHYDRIDLTNADSVVAAAGGAVKAAIEAALGTGAGRHLAALAGQVAPASDGTWPFTIDTAQLVSQPTRAIASIHRSALISGAHPWMHLFAELVALLGIAGPVTGAGTRASPWRVPLSPATGLRLELAAWNEQASGSPADPQLLRLGLRAAATRSGWDLWWLTELLAADLPAPGGGELRLMAGHHVSFRLQPVPVIAAAGGVSISATSFGVTGDWSPGASLQMRGVVAGVSVTGAGTTVNVPLLEFPTPGAVDVTNPGPSFGIPIDQFEALVRILMARASLSWGGVPAFAATALLGLHGNLPGLPPHWPVLRDPGATGSLFTDPPAALRDWLSRVATGAAADGTPFPKLALGWLDALLTGRLPGKAFPAGYAVPTVDGSGTYDDPWCFSVTPEAARPLELLAWLEPAGPPPAWAAPLVAPLAAPGSFPHLLETARALGPFVPEIGAALRAVDVERISAHLFYLSTYLMSSDGVVPVSSQRPTGGTWTAGAIFECSHDRQPSHASAIAQILAQLDVWAPLPASRAVLLLGPAFSDHAQWSALLAAAPGSASAAAHFSLRQPGVDPAAIDLAGVTASADYYTADVADDGTGNLTSLTMQIGRVVDRIRAIRPGLAVTLVAHSTAGIAARAYAAANPAKVAGLITLGTPHAGTPLSPILEEPMASAVRLIRSTGVALPAGSIRDALEHIERALDFSLPPAGPGSLPTAWPYPVASFAGTDTTDTGGVPALALSSQVSPDLLPQLGQAYAAMATATAASVVPAPTHLAFGLRTQLAIPGPALDEPTVDARVRADAFRVALAPGAPAPARPAQGLSASIALERRNGWVLGSPVSYQESGTPVDARVRRAELGLTIRPEAGGAMSVAPVVRLYDAGWHGRAAPRLELGSPQIEPLLGALFRTLSIADPGAGSGVSVLLDALEALGLAVPAVSGGFALSADAFTALQVDAAGFLLPRLGAALDLPDGLGGLKGSFGGPYVLPAAIGPFELYLSKTPAWRLGLRTTGAGFAFAGFGTTAFDLSLAAPSLSPAADLSLGLGALNLAFSTATSGCTLSAPPWLPSLSLRPLPSAAVFTATLGDILPRLLLSAAASAALEAAVGGLVPVGPIDAFLAAPGGSLQRSQALGDGAAFDGAKINQLLEAIAKFAGLPPGPGLSLPGGVRVTASGTGTVTFSVETTAAIGGVLNLQLNAVLDPLRHITPEGSASIAIAAAPGQPAVEVSFGVSAAGVSLTVDPQGIGPIQLLPSFSGLGALAGGAASLLTQALDALDTALAGPPTWYERLRAIAIGLDLYSGGTFSSREAQWKALLQPGWLASIAADKQTAAAAALVQLFSSPDLPGLPGAFSASERGISWTFTPAGATGSLGVKAGWTNGGAPILQLQASELKFGAGGAALSASAGYVPGADPISCAAALTFSLASSLGVPVSPVLSFARAGASYELKLLPLGAATDSTLKLRLAPSSQLTVGANGAQGLAEQWVMPLVGAVLVEAAKPKFATPVWTGGQTVKQLLTHAGLLGPGDIFKLPAAPILQNLAGGLLSGLAGGPGITVPVTGTLALKLVSQGGRVGVRLKGRAAFPVGSLKVGVLFGEPAAIAEEVTAGVALMLFTVPGLGFSPRLEVVGLGASFSMEGGAPLVNLPVFRLGRLAGAVFFALDLQTLSLPSGALGAAVDLGQVAIPLGQAVSQNLGGNNPVAASLLQADGTSGAPPAPAPTVDVMAKYKAGKFSIAFQGQSGALWIPVQRAFGPIYIDQVGLEVLDDSKKMGLLIDGRVQVSGLTVQADDLTIEIPFKSLTAPESWGLDLRGMAVSYSGPGISIGGGLIKNPGPPVAYDGMLTVDVAGKGFTAVGSYARPTDAQGAYTSLFIFVSLPIPLGGPPCFFVTGLGGGAGFNRQLLPPTNVEEVPQFFLVRAIDEPTFGNDPMGALLKTSQWVPPKRGAFWFAAGVRFDSFVIVHSVAVVYVALDRGFEIGVLGVSRMALPTEELAIAHVELALKARFSSAEGILSIQAQLTENSYILTRDCRLTGGFAFFVWFPKGQFVLTLGGYHPNFQPPKEFPVVPRLGFRMRNGPVVVKGEAYFALTNSCVMAGGRLEVAYDLDWVRAWFAAWADFLVSWDPFHYDISIGVEVGVSAHLEICVIVCGTISIDLSIGAQVHIFGPPLHADVTVDLEIVSFTISFGEDPEPEPNYIGSWSTFRDKYLTTGDQDKKAVAVRPTAGLLPPVPPGAEPAPGTKDQPWRLEAEFAFLTETRMPASSWSTFAGSSGGKVPEAASLQIAPMHKLSVESDHDVRVYLGTTTNTPSIIPGSFRVTALIGLYPEATWRHGEKQRAAANTIPAVAGLSIVGAAVLHGQSKLIPIADMVDDLPSLRLPLPFATNTASHLLVLQTWGMAAQTLWAEVAPVSSAKMLSGAQQVLSGAGPFAARRLEAGVREQGLSPLALHTLRTRRSAPPLVTPMTTGLTLEPVGLSLPPSIFQVPERHPVPVKRHRLLAVLQGRVSAAVDAPPALRTSVLTLPVRSIPRMAAPGAKSRPGAALRRIPDARAVRPTRAAAPFRVVTNSETSTLAGPVHARNFAAAAEMLVKEGVVVPAGATHIWEVPPGEAALRLSGPAAARVVFLDAGGAVLSDVELIPETETMALPKGTAIVGVQCLGQAPRTVKAPPPGFAAVTLAAAPARGFAAVGWEMDDVREQVATSLVLGRGASLHFARPHATKHKGQKTPWSMARIADIASTQNGVQTRLPTRVSVVLVILDAQDPCAVEEGDFGIAADGAVLQTPPIPVGGGRRRALLYDVAEPSRVEDHFTVSLASKEGWRVAGVIGLSGRSIEWANRWHGNVPEDLAPTGPLTPHGSVRVQLVMQATTAAGLTPTGAKPAPRARRPSPRGRKPDARDRRPKRVRR